MFKRFVFGLLVLAVMLCGLDCGPSIAMPFHYIHRPTAILPDKVVPIWIDKTFGEQDKIALDDAIMQWNFALNGYIQLQVISTNFDMEPDVLNEVMVKGHGWLLLKIDHTSSFVQDTGSGLTLAFVNEIGGNRAYFIRDRLSSEQVRGVAMHEIGHLLGAKHDNVYLMYPYYNWTGYRCIDEEALKRVAEYQHLDINKLQFCVYGNTTDTPH